MSSNFPIHVPVRWHLPNMVQSVKMWRATSHKHKIDNFDGLGFSHFEGNRARRRTSTSQRRDLPTVSDQVTVLPKADKWPLLGEAKQARPNLAAVVVVWRMMWVISNSCRNKSWQFLLACHYIDWETCLTPRTHSVGRRYFRSNQF
jgi:hypothetical protein